MWSMASATGAAAATVSISGPSARIGASRRSASPTVPDQRVLDAEQRAAAQELRQGGVGRELDDVRDGGQRVRDGLHPVALSFRGTVDRG
jgi:hypothetical protein